MYLLKKDTHSTYDIQLTETELEIIVKELGAVSSTHPASFSLYSALQKLLEEG